MATLRELKGRIGSVASSEKITGAMKMISSAKMHKAEAELRRQQPFRKKIEQILGALLSTQASFSSPLMEVPEAVGKITIVVWGSDEGLCGAYNVNIYKKLIARISELKSAYGSDTEITIIPVGAKIAKIASKIRTRGITVAPMDGVDSKAGNDKVNALLDALIAAYINKETDMVDLLFMEYKSISRQALTSLSILPLSPDRLGETEKENSVTVADYILEPDPQTIFRQALPLYLLCTLSEIFTQNRASQQAARVMAMQSANDNAKKLLEQLRLEFNKLRQQSITTELLDIVGGQVR